MTVTKEEEVLEAQISGLEREGKWSTLVSMLQEQVDRTTDPEERVALRLKLVTIYRDQLHLDAMVIRTLYQILEESPGHVLAMDQLETLLRRVKRWNDLVHLLRQKAAAADDPQAAIDLYLEVSQIFTQRFANRAEAKKALEQARTLDPEHAEVRRQLAQVDPRPSPPVTRGASSRVMVALLLLAAAGALFYLLRVILLP